jgi:hypothetical protein
MESTVTPSSMSEKYITTEGPENMNSRKTMNSDMKTLDRDRKKRNYLCNRKWNVKISVT